MFEKLVASLRKPEPFAPSTFVFWDDSHVSKGLLEAHLDPNLEAASRPHSFIDKSVEWISEIVPPYSHNKILDIGCGPGLYAERFNAKGYLVTGIDFSRKSIEYAKNRAELRNQNITYIHKNYLEMDFINQFDVITLIYCDYAVSSPKDRELLLSNVFKALKSSGKFIFDVFTENEFKNKKEFQTWELIETESFWKPHQHLCMEAHFIYDESLRLDQYVIIDSEEKIDVIRNWFQIFTVESIIAEIEAMGFKKYKIYGDVAGGPYHEQSKTICLVIEKN